MNHSLFDDFEAVSAKQWKQLIQYDLKGGDYNELLLWKSPEGIHVKPFYHSDDFEADFNPIPGQADSWKIAQKIFIADEVVANRIAIDALSRGAEACIFQADKKFDIEKLFTDFPFEDKPLYFQLNFSDSAFYAHLAQILKTKNSNFRIYFDPIGHLVQTGNWYQNQKEDLEILSENVQHGNLDIFIDNSTVQNAGATIVQQLAYALGHANEYLNFFSINGKKVLSEKLKFTFQLATGSNYFFEIAKIRALRLLWASLAREYGISEVCEIHSRPSKRNKTLYDYNVNMLRTTTESMSAILGGADVVSNMAYDGIFHKSNEFGERLSRNQLLILKNESYFDIVSNPADGSYYIESLTSDLAKAALEVFKELEKAQGFLKQLHKGSIQKKIKESAEKEQERFQKGQLKLVGTNYHANDQERMKHELELYPFVKKNPIKTVIEPVVPKRLAQEIEVERLNQES